MNKFKKLNSYEERLYQSTSIMKKYPDRIPVIIQKDKKLKTPDIDKNKYLVPNELKINQLLFTIRNRIKLDKNQAIFLFNENIVLKSSDSISYIYDQYKDEDGFLYINYSLENTFG